MNIKEYMYLINGQILMCTLMIIMTLMVIMWDLASRILAKNIRNIRFIHEVIDKGQKGTKGRKNPLYLSNIGGLKEKGILNFLRWYLPIIMICFGLFFMHGFLLIGIWVRVFVEIVIYQKVTRRKAIFKAEAYRIYEFWNNQLSSGVSQLDAIENVYQAATNKTLRRQLRLMGSYFISTHDIDGALSYIRNIYRSNEATIFCSLVKQIIETGASYGALEDEEESLLEDFVDTIKSRSFWHSVRLGFVAGIFMIGFIAFAFLPDMIEGFAMMEEVAGY